MARTGSPSAAVAKKTSTEQSHSVRTASPSRRASHFSQAVPAEPVRAGAGAGADGFVARSVMATSPRGALPPEHPPKAKAGSCRRGEGRVLEPEVRAGQVAVRGQALHQVRVRVELALEAPDDEAACVVLDLLRVVQ